MERRRPHDNCYVPSWMKIERWEGPSCCWLKLISPEKWLEPVVARTSTDIETMISVHGLGHPAFILKISMLHCLSGTKDKTNQEYWRWIVLDFWYTGFVQFISFRKLKQKFVWKLVVISKKKLKNRRNNFFLKSRNK